MTNTFANIELACIVPSLTNPRKTFDATKLAELAESIKTSGVHQPILVRPLPGSRVADTDRRVTHEIIAGDRRSRAATMAGLTSIPAMIRAMTDDQVLECQLIENLQRDDLSALEEAEGYEALCVATGISKDEVGAKIGKSRSYVYARLKLLDLAQDCKQALREGSIDASRALLIARIPDTTLQTRALAEATRQDFRGEVCSLRTLQSWLHANVMLRLDAAKFSIHDSQLVIGVGNCTTCPKRTGANPDLFSDVQGADICTDPACFHDKEEAHRGSVLDTAAKRGMRLIEGDDAEEICNRYHSILTGYSPLTQERTDTADGQPATLGQLLGKDLSGAVLIENPWTKELIAAMPTAEAESTLLARGLVKAMQAKAASKDDIEADIKRLQARVQKEITKRFRNAAFTSLADVVHGSADQLAWKLITPMLVRAWWLRQVEEMANDDLAKVFGLELVDPDVKTTGEILDARTTQMRLHVQACDSGKLYKALALYMVLDDCPNYFYGDIEEPTLIKALADELDIKLHDIEVQATDEVRQETALELSHLKAQLKSQATAKPAKPLLPLASAAQAEGGGGAKESQKPKTEGPAAPARKRKMSADEAQAAIASAMQDQETDSGADAHGDDASLEPGSGCALPVGAPEDEEASENDEARYATATNLVVIQQVASISRLQRLLGIGYNAAARMIERMETEGIVGPMLPNGTRPVLQPSPIEVAVDPLYQSALDLIVRDQKVNVRLLKSELKIGTAKAMELVAQLEQAGKVSACDERGARKVLVVL